MAHSHTSTHFRLVHGELLSESVRRIVREQIDEAVKHLTGPGANQDRTIRDSRVCCKKIRAVLRLVRTEIGAEIFRREDDWFRDASRRLAPAPDIASGDCILSRLGRRFSDELSGSSIETLIRQPLKAVRPEESIEDWTLADVAASLTSARDRIEEWPLNHEGFSIVAGGLKRCYKEGSNSCYRALDDPSPQNLREWRKQVIYLKYQVSIFRPVWPKVLGSLADQLKRLRGYLSDYCDLIVLREGSSGPGASLELAEVPERRSRIERRCSDLEKKAVAVAQRVYAESPKAFVMRLNEYWSAWRLEGAGTRVARKIATVEPEESPNATRFCLRRQH